jgi:hypothetical protein
MPARTSLEVGVGKITVRFESQVVGWEVNDVLRFYIEELCHAVQSITGLPLVIGPVQWQDVQLLTRAQVVGIVSQGVVIPP